MSVNIAMEQSKCVCDGSIEEASFRNMKCIQELDHQRERVQKTPMTGASYKSHHVDVVAVVLVGLRWEEAGE